MNLKSRILARSVSELVRLACVLALIGLAIMCYSVLSPRALPVIGAMSIGHAIGGAAFLCYLLAVIVDQARRPPRPDSFPPAKAGANEPGEAQRSARVTDESGSLQVPGP